MFENLKEQSTTSLLIARVKKIKDITIDIAAEAIRARKQDVSQILVIPIDKIQTEVGNFYGVSVKEMKETDAFKILC